MRQVSSLTPGQKAKIADLRQRFAFLYSLSPERFRAVEMAAKAADRTEKAQKCPTIGKKAADEEIISPAQEKPATGPQTAKSGIPRRRVLLSEREREAKPPRGTVRVSISRYTSAFSLDISKAVADAKAFGVEVLFDNGLATHIRFTTAETTSGVGMAHRKSPRLGVDLLATVRGRSLAVPLANACGVIDSEGAFLVELREVGPLLYEIVDAIDLNSNNPYKTDVK